MKCDQCDNPAVVHEVVIKHGVKHEIHLCAQHAEAAGIPIPGQQPIDQLLSQFVASASGKSKKKQPKKSRRRDLVCQGCGMRFSQFQRTGVVGCPDCYDAFGKHLGPMIERAQNGGTSHMGKCPARGGGSIDRQLVIQRMVKELEEAVAAEQYERAAELRDRLQEVEIQTLPPPGTPQETA